MKAIIDRDGCISCGLCVATCPDVFQMAADGKAEVVVTAVPDHEYDLARDARSACPVSVISLD